MLGDLSPNGEFEGVKAVGIAAPVGRGGLREAEGVYDCSGALLFGASADPLRSVFRGLPLKGGLGGKGGRGFRTTQP